MHAPIQSEKQAITRTPLVRASTHQFNPKSKPLPEHLWCVQARTLQMSDYRRWRIEGGTYFFTVVTHQRRNLLATDFGRSSLREAFHAVQQRRPFKVIAIVLLPDHLHTIWELPRDDCDYATRWRQIKTLVSRSFAAQFPDRYCSVSASRCRRHEKGVWQRRFFEHTCRDENDVKRLLDYIHVNPVKHKLVSQVRDWAWSSFHRYVKLGEYPPDWGGGDAWYGDEFSRLE